MQRDGSALSTEDLSYALINKRSAEQFNNGKILENPKPGVYAYACNAKEQWHDTFRLHNFTGRHSQLQLFDRFN